MVFYLPLCSDSFVQCWFDALQKQKQNNIVQTSGPDYFLYSKLSFNPYSWKKLRNKDTESESCLMSQKSENYEQMTMNSKYIYGKFPD